MARAVVLVLLVPAVGAHATPPPGAPACPTFPSDNALRADISSLPVHARSSDWLASMGGAAGRLHPDFGPSGLARPYGIPYEVVGGAHPKAWVSFDYAEESDRGPYPIDAQTPIEMGSDAHALMIDPSTCKLYELFAVERTASGWHAGSGAIFDLRANTLRPSTWTSADAAGLPIFAGLVRLDEVQAGVIDHAIRVTASQTDRRFLWPARHQAGARSDPTLPPMGARFRLKAGFDISGFRSDTRVILRAMKRYGLIVADNGSNWYFQGTSEPGWPTGLLDELKSITAGNFEAVDASSLMVDSHSGRVRSGGVRIHKIQFDPAGTDANNLNGEYVVIRNDASSSRTLTGWTLRDSDGNVYRFGTFTLAAGAGVTVYSGRGTNSSARRYWGRTRPVWDNRDTAGLRTASGASSDTCRYYNSWRVWC